MKGFTKAHFVADDDAVLSQGKLAAEGLVAAQSCVDTGCVELLGFDFVEKFLGEVAISRGGGFGFGDIFKQGVEIAGAFFKVINRCCCLGFFQSAEALPGGIKKCCGDRVADNGCDCTEGFESLLFLFRVGEEPAEAGFKGRGFGERGVEFVGNRFHLCGCAAGRAADCVECLQVGDDSYVFG